MLRPFLNTTIPSQARFFFDILPRDKLHPKLQQFRMFHNAPKIISSTEMSVSEARCGPFIVSMMNDETDSSARWITLKKIKYIDQEGKEVLSNTFQFWFLVDKLQRDCGSAQSEKLANQQESMVRIRVSVPRNTLNFTQLLPCSLSYALKPTPFLHLLS